MLNNKRADLETISNRAKAGIQRKRQKTAFVFGALCFVSLAISLVLRSTEALECALLLAITVASILLTAER